MAEGLLFSDCRIAFVPSSTLTSKTISDIAPIVEKYGGEILEPQPSGRLAVHQATHIISNTIDFEDYSKAQVMMVPVVVSEWIMNSLQRRRLAPLRPHSPDPRYIFHAVNVTCADIPPSDRDAIIGATVALGGTESKDLGRLTTHICALSMDHPKCKVAKEKNLKCKIVLPHWFDECFKLGKRIDERPYMLPDPEILKTEAAKDDIDIPSSQHIVGACSAVPDTMPEDMRTRTALNVFSHRKIMLATAQLSASERFLSVVRGIIIRGGGKLTDNVDECDWYVCQYRDGDDYVRASQLGKDVGNLAWLLFLITHDQWTSPLQRLLHYPLPRKGIPGFKGLRITISNYGGEARMYLENLITACGAEYTKTMKQDNTHLITARNNSEKCEAALDWGVSMVNHLWIEESYAKCELLNTTNDPKYTLFPKRTNLSGVIGQTYLQEEILHSIYYPGGDSDAEAVARRRMKSREAAQGPIYSSEAPANSEETMNSSEPVVVEEEQEGPGSSGDEEGVSNQEPTSPVKNGRKRRKSVDLPPLGKASTNKATFTTPIRASRRVGTGKENDTPSSERLPSSRGAKDKAMNRLHGLAPDIALYEKEKKRTTKDGHAPFGGKRATTEMERQKLAAAEAAEKLKHKGRKQRENGNDEDDDAEEVAERPAKRQRPSLPPVEYRVCLTSFSRWTTNDTEENDRRKLRRLGIHIVQEGQPCDYLAAPRVIRTQKFLVGMARGADMIDCKFLEAALDTNRLPDPAAYPLRDKAHPDLARSVARARQNRGKLLADVAIYCTADIEHGYAAFKAIAEANGAIFKIYRARSGTTIRPTTAEEDGGAPPDPVYLISGASAAEKALWPRFEEMALAGHMEPRIVDHNWLLDVAMNQKLTFEERYRRTAAAKS